MKKLSSIIRFVSFLLLSAMLFSCNDREIDTKLAEMLEAEAIVKEMPDEPLQASDVSVSSEILRHTQARYSHIIGDKFTVMNDRCYFLVKNGNANRTNSVTSVAYYDIATNSGSMLCPDPLCSHMSSEECLYAQINELPVFEDDNTCYLVWNGAFPSNVYRYHLDTQQREVIYTVNPGDFCSVFAVSDGKLYLKNYEYQNVNERETELVKCLVIINTQTGDVVKKLRIPDQYLSFLFIHNERIYIEDNLGLLSVNMELGDEKRIEKPYMGDIGTWYFDTDTEELYFSIVDSANNSGQVFCCKNGSVRRILLPDENIYSFFLGNDKIYYSVYEPVFHGLSAAPGNPPTYDYSGGKIYAADRENPSRKELIYDCAGKYVLCIKFVTDYAIFGEQLLFDEVTITKEIIDDAEYVYFDVSMNMSKYHVDLTDGTTDKIGFDS